MYRDPPSSQIVYPQDAAYDIPPECIEHEHLPYWLAVGVEDWCRLWDQTVARAGFVMQLRLLRYVIEVEDALDRGYEGQSVIAAYRLSAY